MAEATAVPLRVLPRDPAASFRQLAFAKRDGAAGKKRVCAGWKVVEATVRDPHFGGKAAWSGSAGACHKLSVSRHCQVVIPAR